MDGDTPKTRSRANGIVFPAAEPEFRTARQRCAEACASYNGQAEFASPEQRARLWQAIVSPQATGRVLAHAAPANESESEHQSTGRIPNGRAQGSSDSNDSEATQVPLANGPSAREPLPFHSPDPYPASQLPDSTSPEARPAVSRVTPPPSPDLRDVPPASPIADDGLPAKEYVVAHTPPPSRKASHPELDAERQRVSINSDDEHDPAVTNPFIVNAPYVKPPVHIDYGTNLHIGAGTFINRNLVVIDSPVCHIRIGERCQFGPNVILAAVEHPLDADERMSPIGSPSIATNIDIGDECWIAAGAKILCGVRIGSGCVIGAGSVVTKDIPDGCMAFGNPARVVRVVSPRYHEKSLTAANTPDIVDCAVTKWRDGISRSGSRAITSAAWSGKSAPNIQYGKDIALLLLAAVSLAHWIYCWL